MQQVHYQSLENHKFQQLSTMHGIWFGIRWVTSQVHIYLP